MLGSRQNTKRTPLDVGRRISSGRVVCLCQFDRFHEIAIAGSEVPYQWLEVDVVGGQRTFSTLVAAKRRMAHILTHLAAYDD